MKKIVYSIDSKGYLLGRIVLNETDLSPKEKDKFLIPSNCIEEAPIAAKTGYKRRYLDGGWRYEEIINKVAHDELTTDQKINSAILKRNKLLRDSDWTQLNDSPLTAPEKKKYKEYRKKLRDLPDSEGFPDIEFPVL